MAGAQAHLLCHILCEHRNLSGLDLRLVVRVTDPWSVEPLNYKIREVLLLHWYDQESGQNNNIMC